MPFEPENIELSEAGKARPHEWLLKEPLIYRTPDGVTYEVRIPRGGFITDLASVPTVLTWLVPRYGLYTKAAVLHDYMCKQDPRFLADEVFGVAMNELGVPELRRRLMVGAVTWPTMLGESFKYLWSSFAVAAAIAAALVMLDLPSVIGVWGWALNAILLSLTLPIVSMVATGGRWGKQIAICVFYTFTLGLLFLPVALVLALIVVWYQLAEDPVGSIRRFSGFVRAAFRARRVQKRRAKARRATRQEAPRPTAPEDLSFERAASPRERRIAAQMRH